jgi:hypothetical protein
MSQDATRFIGISYKLQVTSVAGFAYTHIAGAVVLQPLKQERSDSSPFIDNDSFPKVFHKPQTVFSWLTN